MARRSDRPPTYLLVTPTGYAPDLAYDRETHRQYKVGTRLEATLHEPNNNRFMAKVWTAFKLVVEATGIWPNPSALATEIKLRKGYIDSVQLSNGGTQVDTKSFRDFQGPELEQFWEEACIWLWEHFEIDVDGLLEEDRRMKAETRGRGGRRWKT